MTACGSRFVGPVVRAYLSVPPPPDVGAALPTVAPSAVEPAGAEPAVPAAGLEAAAVGETGTVGEPGAVGVAVEPIGVLGVEQAATSGVMISSPALPTPNRSSWRREMLGVMVFGFPNCS